MSNTVTCPICKEQVTAGSLVKINKILGMGCRDCAAEHERRVQRIAANTATTKGR